MKDMAIFDEEKYYLGPLCKRGHDYEGSSSSLRRKFDFHCLSCAREFSFKYSQTKSGKNKQKQWKSDNREKVYNINKRVRSGDAYKRYQKQHRIENLIIYRLRWRFRNSMKAFSIRGKIKSSKQYGIDYSKIAAYLGSCPGDRGDYHIDHIVPLSFFDLNDPEQIKIAFSPENHQWLKKLDNMKKNDRLPRNIPQPIIDKYMAASLSRLL